MSESVIVLNASHEVLTSVPWERAVTMVVSGIARVHEREPERFIRSQHLEIPFPRIIVLVTYIYVKFIMVDEFDRTTHKSVMARDKNACAYCGGRATTIDHVIPRSRGGSDAWNNLVACCFRCNNFKADRTPKEAGMKLLWEPRVPLRDQRVQQQIWGTIDMAANA